MEPDVFFKKLSFGSINLLIMINNNNIPLEGKVFFIFFSKNKLTCLHSLYLFSHILKNHYSISLINIFLLNKKLNLNKTDEVSFLHFHTYIYM